MIYYPADRPQKGCLFINAPGVAPAGKHGAPDLQTMEMETVGIAVGSGALGAILSFFGNLIPSWLKQKRTIEPQPLAIEKQRTYITTTECTRKMCEHQAQITKLREVVQDNQVAILTKLDEFDSRAEARSKAIHDRIDPLVSSISKNEGKMQLVEQAFLRSTMGGKK